jgi:hypothetical protein
MTQKGIASFSLFLLLCNTKRATAPAKVYLFITPSSAKASSTGKRKQPARAATGNKKGKAKDSKALIKDFTSKYGRIMFSEDGIYQLTPAESARCGVLLQSQQWYLDRAASMGLQGGFQFCHTFAEELQDEEAEIRAQGDEVEHASLESFVNLIDAVGKFCNFDQKFDTKGKLGVVLGSKCSSLSKVDQAAEHFWLHMRNHLFVEASEQRKNGGSTVVLVVALYERMERDYIASSSTKRFVKWFTDEAAMQNGLTNHTAALDIDGKGVCVEVIEELLLSASVTTADVDNCTAEWGEAEAFVTEQKKKSALAFFIQQARVEAAYRVTLKKPGLQRQISSASSAPDSAFGRASSTCPSSGLSSAPDPAFGAHRFSDVEDGSSWGTAGERASFAARLRQRGRSFRRYGRLDQGRALSCRSMACSTAQRWLR